MPWKYWFSTIVTPITRMSMLTNWGPSCTPVIR